MDETINKTTQLLDELTQSWFDVYEAPGLEGQLITATVPREDRGVAQVRRHLLRKGAVLSGITDAALASAIASDAPVVRRAARTGWRDEGSHFVSHLHVAGGTEQGQVVPPDVSGSAGQLKQSGSLEGWKALASLARYSTAMIIALCAVFAAALLAMLRRPSFALMLVGRSRSGKSTAQLLAASALGYGTEEHLPSLNATPPGLLAAALSFNDHMLPINEVGTARGPKRDVYVVLRDTTYALMSGQDVLRHPSWTGATGSAHGTFQVLPLLSSEISPDAWAARNGEVRDEGESVRLIGVPVARGRKTIFDLPPAELGTKQIAWEKKQFRKLRQGLPEHRGVAFPAYIDALVQDRQALGERALRLVQEFENKIGTSTMTPVARDIVGKFGVLWAGGTIAIKVGVLPVAQKVLNRAVKRACRASLAELPDPERELRSALGRLKRKLESGAIIDIESCTRKQLRMMRNADGFKQPKNTGYQFVIRAQAFSGLFRIPLQARRILEWLDSEGYLDHGRNPTRGRSNEWAQKQVTWPDGTRQRSIVIYLPGGLADLEQDGGNDGASRGNASG